jgi:hypothetical protein
MGKSRKVHGSGFKAKMALAALKESETASQLACRYLCFGFTLMT